MRPLRALAKVSLTGWRGVLAALGWLVSRPFVVLPWLRNLRVDVWCVEGEEQNSHLPLSVLCTLTAEDKNYGLYVIFGDSYRQRYLGRFWSWNLAQASAAASPECSMILREISESNSTFSHSSDGFFIPMWLLGEVDLPRTAVASHKVSGDLRRIRRHGLCGEITRDPKHLDDFYFNMLVPYATQRFGVCADLASYERVRRAFRSCDLVLVKNHETSVAGQLIAYDEEYPHLWEMGIRNGNGEYVKDGAGCALYHFGLQHLQEKGYRKAWLGWSRPFLRDGVLQYKRKWSQRLTRTANYGCALQIRSYAPAVKAFLCHNPFVFKRRGLCYAAVFVDGDKPLSAEDIRKLHEDYFHPGLTRLLIYDLQPERATMPSPVPAEFLEHIEMRSVRNLPHDRSLV
jgi:hypothetical protein